MSFSITQIGLVAIWTILAGPVANNQLPKNISSKSQKVELKKEHLPSKSNLDKTRRN